ncbi:unnamed protein product [Anisakis simplex]|uniref:Late endosomal/lysosomal adaptor and MAPK and MTOR activator 1 n=1 Tax=Anisakis simplex TaxID=6269 RepID=A0A0M3JS76_ANISI|nr:unnamed protein product [Anisakis simplex]
MSSKLVSCMRTMCCCDGEASDDERPFVNAQNQADVISARETPTGYSNEAINRLWSTASASDSLQGTPQAHRNIKQGDEEDELLNQILESTQQNIIDVSNMESSIVTSATNSDVTKAHQFEDAIKQHDLRIRKSNAATASHGISTTRDILLKDIGAYAADVLGRDWTMVIDDNEYDALKRFASQLLNSIENGIQIEHTEDIIVHMSFCDD